MPLSHIPIVATLAAVLYSTPLIATTQSADATGAVEQAASIVFRGQVLDAEGRAVASAAAFAFQEGERAPVASASSDDHGCFAFTLSAGTYLITVSRSGFMQNLQTLSVAPGQASARFILNPSRLQETITVNSSSDYLVPVITSGTKTPTALLDVPQSVTIITSQMMQDQLMTGVRDVIQYVPGVTLHQGENNRDQIVMRGNISSADFFLNGVRDDVQYYRDLYNVERVEALKGPNAMIFGRGGAGGVINRVTKEAALGSFREVALEGGGQDNRRITGDFNEALGDRAAIRLNGLYEDSGSFRYKVGLERYGLAPTLTFVPSDATKITVGYEHLRDVRVADRGITSVGGKPADVPLDTFYGNPDDSRVRNVVDLTTASIEHHAGKFTITNRSLFGDYDRFYQNYVPGAVNGNGEVSLTAYNNATTRRNLFNQTNLTFGLRNGALQHTVLAGIELGQQRTDNLRNTGFFGEGRSSVLVPFSNPTTTFKADFRQSPTDADNHVEADVAALYAQDQITVSDQLQFIAGLRVDRFDLRYLNHRNGDRIGRVDNLISPRAGVVFKPISALSVYGSYSVSSVPSSGDQFSSLTDVTRQLEPEKLTNYEVGTKWDASKALSITTGMYRLTRTNTRATDPNDPSRILQTGSQRTDGLELGVNGRLTGSWDISGGYARQDARVTSATAVAPRGALVGQVPKNTLSIWNKVRISDRSGVGLGAIYRSAMFATIDNTVVLGGYTRFDAAAYFRLSSALRLQLNVENLLNRKYFANADSNTNISPGSPRFLRIGLTATF